MGMFIFWLTLIVGIWLLWNICRNTGESLDKQTAIQYEIVSLEKRLDELSEQLKNIQAPAGATKESTDEQVLSKELPSESVAGSTKVSINSSDIKDLVLLPRIGNALAKRIVEARPYNSIDDLLKVQGISPDLLDDLQGRIEL